ncbi:MAG: hypothetical protein IKB64_05730 [Paludibacteraceae bacterium]|nr:hypothetical protein [Paludibacteraceae bacterium]
MPSNRPMTIKQLLNFCKQEIQNGNGDCSILLSDDDEGNGYHYCWYAFTPVDEYTEEYVDPDINPKDKTIILG